MALITVHLRQTKQVYKNSSPHNIEAPSPAKIGTNSSEIWVAIFSLFMYIKKILFVIKPYWLILLACYFVNLESILYTLIWFSHFCQNFSQLGDF